MTGQRDWETVTTYRRLRRPLRSGGASARHRPARGRVNTAMTPPEVHGPVDFLLLEFPADRLTGRAAEEVLNLVDRGIVRVYDVLVVGKDKDGKTYGVDFLEEAAEQLGGFSELAGAHSGLLTEED